MAKVKKKAVKVKKKHWFKVIAPKAFEEKVLGETYVAEASLMQGKPLSLNLKCFAYRMSKQNISLSFIINEVKESKAYCSLTGYKLLQASIKRMAARGKEKVTDSFVVKSQDNQNVRIKFILITTGKASNSILTSLRRELRKHTADILAGLDYEEILLNTVGYKIQPKLKKILVKVYPVRMCAIKEIYIEKRKNSLKNVLEGTPVKKVEREVENRPVKQEESKTLPKKEEVPKEEIIISTKEEKEVKEEVKDTKKIVAEKPKKVVKKKPAEKPKKTVKKEIKKE